MYKIALLGSENSHAETFVRIINGGGEFGEGYSDFEVVGAYGTSFEANEKLKALGVTHIAESFDEFAGKVDAVMITARHGDNHLKYAEPYFKYGIPMFIDKPFTVSEEDALTLIKKAKENGCVLCGGSVLKLIDGIKDMKAKAGAKSEEGAELGEIISGSASAPLIYIENAGGFFFYSQHLVEMILEVFGPDVKSVCAFSKDNEEKVTAVFRYENFDVTAHFGASEYTVTVHGKKASLYKSVEINKKDFKKEFDTFAQMVRTKKSDYTLKELILPVFVLNAINRSLKSGKEEEVHTFEF